MKFKEYLPLHEEVYPRPEKRRLALGWEFWVSVAVAVAAIILASLRTANSFFTAAALSAGLYGLGETWMTTGLSLLEAIAAMLAIEGGIVYGAVKRAQQNGKVHPRLFIVYLTLLISISIVAGLGQSLGLVLGLTGELLAAFTWIMAIVLGVGASIVAWLSGEMLGVEMLKFTDDRKGADKAYNAANTRWLNDARKHWLAERKELKEEPAVAVHIEQPGSHTLATAKAQAFIDKTIAEKGRVPTVGEMSRGLGWSDSYVRGILEEIRRREKSVA